MYQLLEPLIESDPEPHNIKNTRLLQARSIQCALSVSQSSDPEDTSTNNLNVFNIKLPSLEINTWGEQPVIVRDIDCDHKTSANRSWGGLKTAHMPIRFYYKLRVCADCMVWRGAHELRKLASLGQHVPSWHIFPSAQQWQENMAAGTSGHGDQLNSKEKSSTPTSCFT
ncbi:hypothetical protein RRG08_007118 [Elysia crispata]|uniref:Uncharacterized protein n=1 Tax=Elysia crispata TaxID=231223 RepID=A0AAE0Y8X2_9GAST|nr:hypothetical protein RRG08_007118 [Elysia crispata]